MAIADPIRIDGLRELSRDLKKISADAPKALRVSANRAAELVVDTARGKVPKRSGRAARSIRAASTRTAARVRGGGNRVPYYPWLDYGGEGRVKGRPAARRFVKEGRYLYPSYYAVRDQVEKVLADELRTIVADTGWDVS